MYLALDATAVPAFASTGSSSATTMERFPEGEVNILADEDCFAEALNAVFQATADRRGQARGDVMRQQGTYRPRIKPISLPRTSSKRPTPKGMAFISTAIAGARLAS